MKNIALGGAASLLLTLAACNGSNEPGNAQPQSSPAFGKEDPDGGLADQTYAASGTVTDVKGNEVTISHGPVPAIGWPAMTMTFTAGQPELAASVRAGDRVSFEFRKSAGGATLTSLSKL